MIPPPFLDPLVIRSCCADAGLAANYAQAFVDFAAGVRADPELARQATAARDHLFDATGTEDETVARAEAAFDDDAHLLRGLMLLESIRLVRERQNARGVPADITHATLDHHPCSTLRDYAAQHGRAGADRWIWSWYRTVGSGDLYRLGRLEFIPEKWVLPFRFFVHTQTGETLAILDAGERFDDEGYNTGATTWATTLTETDEAIVGCPISPRGFALQAPVRLPRREWRLALGPGDTVLDMHIPGDEPLTIEPVRTALLSAEPFFDHFYPEQRFVAYVCDSWVFSTQLEAMLPPESNILRMQCEGYLFPVGDGQAPFLNFTFGATSIDLATAPRDTRLRRAVIAHMEKGGTLRCGGFLLLRRDLARFGEKPYRNYSHYSGLAPNLR